MTKSSTLLSKAQQNCQECMNHLMQSLSLITSSDNSSSSSISVNPYTTKSSCESTISKSRQLFNAMGVTNYHLPSAKYDDETVPSVGNLQGGKMKIEDGIDEVQPGTVMIQIPIPTPIPTPTQQYATTETIDDSSSTLLGFGGSRSTNRSNTKLPKPTISSSLPTPANGHDVIDAHPMATSSAPNVQHDYESNHPKSNPDAPKTLALTIECCECGKEGAEAKARAFVRGPTPLSIVLCSNRLVSAQEVDQALVHELIHVYDVIHRNYDLSDCRSLAKSEIRAAREAECGDTNFMFKSNCTKTRATVATRNMFPSEGEACVGKVFKDAYEDLVPFHGGDGDSMRDSNGKSYKKHLKRGSGKSSPPSVINGRAFRSSYQ